MLKKLRDFIYDINDIFVAIIILALAAGVIYWRSANIVEYPKYLAEKNHVNASSDIDFSGINLDPEPVDTAFNPNPEDQGSFVDPSNPPAENTVDPSDVPVPGKENTANNSNNSNNANNAGNTNEAENEGNTANNAGNEEPETIEFVVPDTTSWYDIADRLGTLGLIEDTDAAKIDFVYTAAGLGFDTMLQPGTYELSIGMSPREIIEIICRIR